jgi:hypothetical protein
MPQVLLHIGYPKTGSNFIQHWFASHPDVYFRLDKMAGFGGPKEIPLYANNNAALHKLFVLSEEQLSVWGGKLDIVNVKYTPGDIKSLQEKTCATLHALYPAATVLIFTRGYESLLKSQYSHYIKIGGTLDVNDFLQENVPNVLALYDYTYLISKYVEYFGKDNVVVMPYELLRESPEKFTRYITDRLSLRGIEADYSKKNESLDGWRLYKYRRLSSMFRSMIDFLPYNAQLYVYSRYQGLLFYGKLEPLMKFIKPQKIEQSVPSAILAQFKHSAQILKNEPLYQPYLKEYML